MITPQICHVVNAVVVRLCVVVCVSNIRGYRRGVLHTPQICHAINAVVVAFMFGIGVPDKYHFAFGNAINRAPTVVSLCRLSYRVVVPNWGNIQT